MLLACCPILPLVLNKLLGKAANRISNLCKPYLLTILDTDLREQILCIGLFDSLWRKVIHFLDFPTTQLLSFVRNFFLCYSLNLFFKIFLL